METCRKRGETFIRNGITSVWFPPAYKGTNGRYYVGYDAYNFYDLGEFDQKYSIHTKYGTKQDYIKALKKEKFSDIQSYTKFTLVGRGKKYSIKNF
jgi:alpha-amylase